MTSQNSKNNKMREPIILFMKELNKWDEEMLDEIPLAYEKYGDHILFSEPAFASRNWRDAGDDLWKLICKLYHGNAVAVKGRIQNDNCRTPRVRLLYGNTTTVNIVDNEVKYTWDIKKSMFCAGNVTERHRIAKLNCEGEVIVDLFAGIGYFTLPYLVHAKAKFVHACEWNENAVESLKRNLEINGVSGRCQIYEGDNRKVSPRKVANRVNLGLIPSSVDYWEVACDCLLDTGGILYIHQNVTSKFSKNTICDICERIMTSFQEDIKEKKCNTSIECYLENGEYFWNQLQEYSLKFKHIEWFIFAIHITHSIASFLKSVHSGVKRTSVRDIFKVKSYAPHIDHLVYTVHCYS